MEHKLDSVYWLKHNVLATRRCDLSPQVQKKVGSNPLSQEH